MYSVVIKGEINDKTIDLIDAAIAQNDNDIMLSIDSYGGSLQAGFTCYDKIRESRKNFHANVVKTCMSSATLLLVACPMERRTASPHATILIHNPLVDCGYASLNEVKNVYRSMEDAKDKLVQIYAERTLMDAKEVSDLMDNEQELYATDCIKRGLIAKTNELYNYYKKDNKSKKKKMQMKKSFLNILANKVVASLLKNELMVAEDGTELEISALEVGGTCSVDGIFVVNGNTITVENGIIIDVIPAEEVVNESEGEEVSPETVEEVAEAVAEETESIIEEEVSTEDAEAIAEAVRSIVEEALENKYKPMIALIEDCGGFNKLKALAKVKRESKVFNSKPSATPAKKTIAELVALKRKK